MAIAAASAPELQQHLIRQLNAWPAATGYIVAYSGGGDSTALLHALSEAREALEAPLRAVHINHGLHPDSDHWQRHCESQCQAWQLPLDSGRVSIENLPRQSLEAQARDARYAWIKAQMAPGEILLTAHHGNDQAETLLLNLMRGAGITGMAAMRSIQPWGRGYLARPLLMLPQELIQDYLRQQQLQHLQDPSNEQTAYRRNFIRREVLPLLQSVWPAAAEKLNQSARHCREASTLLADLAAADLASVGEDAGRKLKLQALAQLSQPRQKLLIRQWIEQLAVPMPSMAVLDQLLHQALDAAEDSTPLITWPGGECRRYRQWLYCQAPMPPTEPNWQQPWSGEKLTLPNNLGQLCLLDSSGHISQQRLNTSLELNLSRSGRLRLNPDSPRRNYKYLCQKAAIPPWLRGFIPFLRRDNRLLAIGDIWLDQEFISELQQQELKLSWTPGMDQWLRLRDAILQPADKAKDSLKQS